MNSYDQSANGQADCMIRSEEALVAAEVTADPYVAECLRTMAAEWRELSEIRERLKTSHVLLDEHPPTT